VEKDVYVADSLTGRPGGVTGDESEVPTKDDVHAVTAVFVGPRSKRPAVFGPSEHVRTRLDANSVDDVGGDAEGEVIGAIDRSVRGGACALCSGTRALRGLSEHKDDADGAEHRSSRKEDTDDSPGGTP
jgi:hypothetical protein